MKFPTDADWDKRFSLLEAIEMYKLTSPKILGIRPDLTTQGFVSKDVRSMSHTYHFIELNDQASDEKTAGCKSKNIKVSR